MSHILSMQDKIDFFCSGPDDLDLRGDLDLWPKVIKYSFYLDGGIGWTVQPKMKWMRPMVSQQRAIDIKHFYEGNPIFWIFGVLSVLFCSNQFALYISVIAGHFPFV